MCSTSTTTDASSTMRCGAAVAGRRSSWHRWGQREMLAEMRVERAGRAGTVTLTPRPVASSLDELLAGATSREPFFVSDSKSGSPFERVIIDGDSYIVKHIHIDADWTMRFNGDIGCKPAQVWQAGLMDVLPDRIEQGGVGVLAGLGG